MRAPRELLRDHMDLEPFGGNGARGPVFGAVTVVRCQWQDTRKIFLETDNTGTTVACDVMVVIRPEDGPVAAGSRVTHEGDVFRVVRAYPMPDSRRPYHYELALARWASQAAAGSGS